jgi:hypothetical protein
MAWAKPNAGTSGVIWVLLGVGLWICLSVVAALCLAMIFRPRAGTQQVTAGRTISLNPDERDSAEHVLARRASSGS